jgi:hypothetical protein
MPLEASGREWFDFAYGDDWQRHAGLFATGQVKVLVRDNRGSGGGRVCPAGAQFPYQPAAKGVGRQP